MNIYQQIPDTKSGMTGLNPTPTRINEPTIIGRLLELEGYISTMEDHSGAIRSALFGEGESGGPERQVNGVAPLEVLLAQITERAAGLCGSVATIRQRLGCRTGAREGIDVAISERVMPRG